MGNSSSSSTIKCDNIQTCKLISACRSGNIDMAKRLLDEKVNPDIVYSDTYPNFTCYESPLHEACRYNMLQTAKLLLEHKVNVNVQIYGSTPLWYACIHDNYEMVEMLLQAGAIHGISDKIGKFGGTGLYRENDCFNAILMSHAMYHETDPRIVNLLIEKGAKIKQKHLLLACEQSHIAVLKIFIEKGPIPSSDCLEHACTMNDPEMVIMLLQSGVIVTDKAMKIVREIRQDLAGIQLMTLVTEFHRMQQTLKTGKKVDNKSIPMGQPIN